MDGFIILLVIVGLVFLFFRWVSNKAIRDYEADRAAVPQPARAPAPVVASPMPMNAADELADWVTWSYDKQGIRNWIDLDDYPYEVVGESFHADSFRLLMAGQQGTIFPCRAQLVPEANNPYDAQAVLVKIAKLPVGHLSRGDAAKYRAAYGDARRTVSGVIKGGTSADPGQGTGYGVLLKLKV